MQRTDNVMTRPYHGRCPGRGPEVNLMRSSKIKPVQRHVCAALLTMALCLSGCSALTDVKATDVTDPDALANPAGAATLYAGAIATFTSAFAAYPIAQFLASGLIADEFITAPPQGSWADFDFRVLEEPGGQWPYEELQRARIAALQAIEGLRTNAPEPPSRIGEMFAYIGYVETFLGENMCSGIPLSALVDNEPVFGEQLTTAQMFEHAVSDFDSAAAYAGTSSEALNLARVGRGRALLNLARFGEAADAVRDVPTDFRLQVEMSATTTLEYNGYYYSAYLFSYVTVHDSEGTNGLNFVSANDPRVPLQLGEGNYGLPHYQLPKYSDPNAPVELASGIEARVIEAEAAYQENPSDVSAAGWLGILNELRATAITPALPPLDDPGDNVGREDLIFRERAFWLYATGHRHGDLRRLVRQYDRDVESVFPTGLTVHGIPYGQDVNIAPPERQETNPNYTGCLDREA